MKLIDSYFDTREEAIREMAREKTDAQDETIIIKCEKTSYGNWRVYAILADIMVDSIPDGYGSSLRLGFHRQKSAWAE